MDNNKYAFYISDDLPFVASAILTGRVQIKRVTFHPNKQGVKQYHLSPRETAQEIYLEYVSDQIKMSPQQLSSKIAVIKHLQAETERNNDYGY